MIAFSKEFRHTTKLNFGRVAERLNASDSKSEVLLRGPGVQIPPLPNVSEKRGGELERSARLFDVAALAAITLVVVLFAWLIFAVSKSFKRKG